MASADWTSDRPAATSRLDMLRRRWPVALATAAAVFALTGPFLAGLPKLYRASASLLVEGPAPQNPSELAVPGATDARLQTIKQEALSRTKLQALIDEYNLYPESRGRVPVAVLADRLQRDIRVDNMSTEPINGQLSTVAFKLSYVSSDPATAAAVTNALAHFYVDQNDQIRSRRATRNATVLADQLKQTKARLDEQESRVRDYAAKNVGALPQQLEANLSALQRLNVQLQLVTDEQMRLTERRQMLSHQIAEIETAPPPPPTDPNSPAARLIALRKELTDLGGTSKHPDVKTLNAQIDALEKQIAKDPAGAAGAQAPSRAGSLKATLQDVDSQLSQLASQETALRESIRGYEHRVDIGPSQVPEFQALTRDAQATRDQFDALQKRYEEARISERAEQGTANEEFRILDSAQAPAGPSGPPPSQLVVIALVLSLIVGLAVAAILESMDPTFHTVDDVREFTKVPILVSIPRIWTARDRRRAAVGAVLAVGLGAAALVALATGASSLAHHSEGVARLLLRLG